VLISGEMIEGRMRSSDLVEPLREAFKSGAVVPERTHLEVGTGGDPATLLLMPAWRERGSLGIKIATVHPDNARRDLPSVHANYLLLDAATGETRALIDGRTLTLLRTAAVSALAADFLADPAARRLLVVGAGALVPHLVEAHSSVRSYSRIGIWARDPEKAARLVQRLDLPGEIEVCRDLEAGVRAADVVSAATLATEPLVKGAWLAGSKHIDLVGGFRPTMREADDEAIARARVFVDTPTALREAGDLAAPLASGVIDAATISTLADLVRKNGRCSTGGITLFKSVGTALADLAAAERIVRVFSGPQD